MKAQYVGDVGDFGKVLLLKHLAGLGLSLGVNWILTENDDRSDGKHRDYVDYRGLDCLSCCDRQLLERIDPIAKKTKEARRLQDIEELILEFATDAIFYGKFYEKAELAIRDREAFEILAKAELIFFDPDNGVGKDGEASPKHIYLSELSRYWTRGQSILIYHHLARSGSHLEQIQRLKKRLKERFNTTDVHCIRLCRGTGRAYLLCVHPAHSSRIPVETREGRIKSLTPLMQTKGDWRKYGSHCR